MICLKYLKEKKKIATQNSLSGKIITFIIAGKRKNVPVIKAVWNYREKRHMGQWNSMESQGKNACTYGQLIYDKGGKNIQWGKDSHFNKEC